MKKVMTIEKTPDQHHLCWTELSSSSQLQKKITNQVHSVITDNPNKLNPVKNLNTISEEILKLQSEPFSVYVLDIQDRDFYTEQQTIPHHILEKEIENSLQKEFSQKGYTVFKGGKNYALIYKGVQTNQEEARLKKLMKNFYIWKIYDRNIYQTIHVWYSREHRFALEQAQNALRTESSFCEFDQKEADQLQLKERENIKWRERVLTAFTNWNFIAHFQPIVDGRWKVVKYESLARLVDEDSWKVYSPWEFMKYVEKFWLHPELTEVMLDSILYHLDKSKSVFTVNFTDEDINSEEIYEKIKNDFVWKYDKLIIEILETVTREDTTYENLRKYKELWIKFAIDDFWTGLSNIRRLLELECDYLKLDSSLLKWIKKNDISSYKYLSHIYDMAKSLWLTVVAEWIEDIEIQEILEELWIEEYQWYYHWEPQANLI